MAKRLYNLQISKNRCAYSQKQASFALRGVTMNQRIMLTKKLLKTSLTDLLQTQSIYHISIRELCENAGINRSTFYKYYGSQFDLLYEMEQDLLASIEEVLALQTDYSTNAIEQILIYLENDIAFVRLLINSNVDPEFPKKLFSLPPILRMLNELMAGAPEEESEYRHRFLLFGAYEAVRTWVNKDDRERPEWLAAFLYRTIMTSSRVV